MKMKYALLAIAVSSAANAAVTLGFSTAANVSEGWANSSGSKNAAMAWGIIVDVDGDGFDGFATATETAVDGGFLLSGVTKYDSGFTRTPSSGAGSLPGGQVLKVNSTATDDVIFFSSNLMAVVGSEARATQLSGLAYGTGMAAGDKYAVVWFDATTLGGAATTNSDKFGAWYKTGASAFTGTVLPADPGSYTAATNGPAGMWGADNTAGLKVASMTFIPETSTALLGALGALGLLRRRR